MSMTHMLAQLRLWLSPTGLLRTSFASFLRGPQSRLLPLLLVVLLTSGCNVVVPRFAPANVGGFALSGDYDPEEPYAVGTLQCRTELYPNIILPTEVATPSAAYLAALNAAYPAWTFNTAATGLSQEAIEIKTYDAIGASIRAGVWIHARYVPHATDPTNNIHWIQILTTNHGLQGTGHGPSATYIDNTGGTTPYYDEGYVADSRNIIDRPFRSDAAADHTWEATTFLVMGPAVGAGAGTVTIQTPGFTWGWKNTCNATDGLVEFYFYSEQSEKVVLQERPRPGGMLILAYEQSTLILAKEKQRAPVKVSSKEIRFVIDESKDPHGWSKLTNASGRISFEGYEFGGKNMQASSSNIIRGSGWIHIETGEASLEYVIPFEMPNGTSEDIVFTGTGQYDKVENTFLINSDVQGISEAFLRRNVPVDTRKDKEKSGGQ